MAGVIKKLDKETLKQEIINNLKTLYRKDVSEVTLQMVYQVAAYAVKEDVIDNWIATQKAYDKAGVKKAYYLSMEFLVDRALGDMMLALKEEDVIRETVEELGFDLTETEGEERDPAFGNGGLSRPAACLPDSFSTLNYPAYGCGIRYHYGMFRQKIENGYQKEIPDDWLKNGYPLEIKRDEYACEVKLDGYVATRMEDGNPYFYQKNYQSVRAVSYDLPIVGHDNHIVNTLRIWGAEVTTSFRLDSSDRGGYQRAVGEQNLTRAISEVLYPNDNHYSGKEPRLKQQYFFISASLQTAVKKLLQSYDNIRELPNYVVFQMNDTHSTVVMSEFVRILTDEQGLGWEEAWAITSKACVYTSHTTMTKALEKWPIELSSRLLPRIHQIVEGINRYLLFEIEHELPGDQARKDRTAIIHDGQMYTAFMACAASFSINSAAKIHTEILEKQTLRDFYELSPEKFNNKTNGVAQHRFLSHVNPLLADWITGRIGDKWITDFSEVKKLGVYVDDKRSRQEYTSIKYKNKVRLANYILEHNGIVVDPHSIFNVQVKRLYGYKRQLMNILHVMHLYNKIKDNPDMPFYPHTLIFGVKAAADYYRVKPTIKLTNAVADAINNDASINGKIKVVFIEDYCVPSAETIFVAVGVSEQVSTVSREVSDTSNMKFIPNGVPTLGMMDGANIETVKEIGEEDTFIFGMSVEEVTRLEQNGGYNPAHIFNADQEIRRVLVQLVNGFYSPDDPERFRDICNSLLTGSSGDRPDVYFILRDFRAYTEAHERVDRAYVDEENWVKMCMRNIAVAGPFSSDRTVEEYARDIWRLKKVEVKF